ncbi:hypothetical protein IP88_16000 [alpha proteobacterium AAP81b]|nr:hypothetical protein IP88_16000 [alpha proteobacterium AAP81b]
MIVDSSALLAIILAEPEEEAFSLAIYAAARPQMSAASYLEVALKLDSGATGLDPVLDAALANLDIELVPVSIEQGRLAREANVRFGRESRAKLNFGDCLAYALAKATRSPLLFKGNDFMHTDIVPALPAGV